MIELICSNDLSSNSFFQIWKKKYIAFIQDGKSISTRIKLTTDIKQILKIIPERQEENYISKNTTTTHILTLKFLQ